MSIKNFELHKGSLIARVLVSRTMNEILVGKDNTTHEIVNTAIEGICLLIDRNDFKMAELMMSDVNHLLFTAIYQVTKMSDNEIRVFVTQPKYAAAHEDALIAVGFDPNEIAQYLLLETTTQRVYGEA